MSFILPNRRPKVRSGIERGYRREYPRHRKFVRSRECVLARRPGHDCEGQIECCHLRFGTDGYMDAKPSDWWTWSGCTAAHRQQHDIGEHSFQARWNINLREVCLTFAKASTDLEMRRVMKEIGLLP